MKFSEVVKNYGDIKRAGRISIQGMHEGARHENVVDLGSYGANTYGNPTFTGERGELSISRRVAALEGARKMIYERKLHEAMALTYKALTGSKRDRFRFEEAMSTSDFPNLFGDVIDRAVLSNYMETPHTWEMYCKAALVQDFRPVKRFRVDGGTGLLGNTLIKTSGLDASGNLIPINQGTQYPEDSLSDAAYTYRLQKYGKRMPFTWETFIDDDLDALKDTPARFGRGARNSEEYFVTKLFANNTSFFSTANKNIVTAAVVGDSGTNNPAFDIVALQRALIVMMNQLDTSGQPISIEAVTLVVSPSLKVKAMNVLNTDYVWMADQGGTTIQNAALNAITGGQTLQAQNWAKNIVRLAVNYQLPLADTVHGTTGWYLFANPENGRPALEFGRLRSAPDPELFMKSPNSIAIGEGTMDGGVMPGSGLVSPLAGDFDTDSINYKIRHCFGGVTEDPIQAVYSNGSGS